MANTSTKKLAMELSDLAGVSSLLASERSQRTLQEALASAAPQLIAPAAKIGLLATELARHPLGAQRRAIIEALGLSRRPQARALLLELVRSDNETDAEAALSALAIHRYDARLVEQLRDLTAQSPELERRFRALYVR